MARKRGARSGHADRDIASRAEWIVERLTEYGEGIHRLGSPALMLDATLPESVAAIYREFNGAELFHESVVLLPGDALQESEGRFLVGECGGDDIFVDRGGTVWRFDRDLEEALPEGTRFDRWLAGVVDAESVLYDKEGEFLEGIFNDDGELSAASEAERSRRQLKRDPKAVAPRWRLARALMDSGDKAAARKSLEDVVGAYPDFPWAWFDLARISEEFGDYEVASEEAEQAAMVRAKSEYGSFFLAHAARLAQVAGQEERCEALASRVLEADPELPRRHVEAARERIEAEDTDTARELLILAKVVAPRDLHVIDLLAQIQN